MPGLSLVRPADANETAQAWRLAVEADGPVGLVLTRQNIPVLAETADGAAAGVARGAYVLADPRRAPPDIVLVGTGSEVQHCLAAADHAGRLAACGRGWCRSRAGTASSSRTEDYRAERLPTRACRCSASRRARPSGGTATPTTPSGIDHFGASAPVAVVMEKFGFTPEHVVERARALLARRPVADPADRRRELSR